MDFRRGLTKEEKPDELDIIKKKIEWFNCILISEVHSKSAICYALCFVYIELIINFVYIKVFNIVWHECFQLIIILYINQKFVIKVSLYLKYEAD